VRDASKLGFESRVLGKHVTRTYALESLVIGSFLRGLSTRDVEAVLDDTFEQPISSRSTVSRILEDTRERYRRWCERRLDEHALRNVTAKLPERHHRELKARWWRVFDEATSAADARRGLEAIIADYCTAYPSAMAVIERDLGALVAHLRWPSEHRKRIRTTNLLERTSRVRQFVGMLRAGLA
jgi:transposase-like protein